MNRRFRSNRPFRARRDGGQLIGILWLLGIAYLAFTHNWWPGILVLVAISMVATGVLNAVGRSDEPDVNGPAPMSPPSGPVETPTPFKSSAPEPMSAPAPKVATTAAIDLPDRCPHCGGPTGGRSARSLESDPAICHYCGSRLSRQADRG